MSKHSYSVLEFDKLKNKILEFVVIEENKNKLLNLDPYKDMSSLKRELDLVRDFMDLISYDGGFETIGLKDISLLTEKIKLIGTYLEKEELWDININLRMFRVFKTKIEDLGKYKNLRDFLGDTQPIKSVEDAISKAVDNEKNIKDDASLDLRDIRIQKKMLVVNIKRKFDELFENSSVSNAFQEKIVTERDGRMVAPVKVDFKGQIKGIEHDRSASGQTVFIEPMNIVALNNKMRELEVREKEEIRKILLRLAEIIRNNKVEIDKVANTLKYLDLLNAKSIYGVNNACVTPNITSRDIIILNDARHPFIARDKVVPISLEIGKNYNLLLITGPNTGGKTVVLKTVGLLTLMTLSGIPIPANENSIIGFFKGVFADIGDEQSIEQSLSSFSGHLKNIQDILVNMTKDSLILLDELGSGTDPIEGSAFAMSVIDYLKERNCKAIITTHYSEVKAHAYNEPGIESASMEFDTNTLSPTFKLLVGIPGESNALTIARRLGLSEEIITKAQSYISEDNKKMEVMISSIKSKSDELEAMKARLEKMEAEAKENKDKYEETLKDLEKQKKDILKQAYADAEKMMNDIRSKASSIVEKIQKEDNKKEDLKKLQKSLNMIGSAIRDEKNKVVEETKQIKRKVDFKVGDRVFLKTVNQYAIVLKINNNKATANVQAGILKMEVPFDDIKVSEEKKEKKYNTVSHKKTSVRNEIDLRGKMVDEAIYELESYFDRAVLNSFAEVYVIHGKGTGALRDGILKYLKSSRYVKGYRVGGHGEGGLGCTVVELK